MKYRPPRYLFRRHEVMKRIRPGESFIEIGAADLTLTRELLQRFERGLAIDFTDDLPDSYEQLPDHLKDRLRISNVDVIAEDIDEQCNCVVACEVMEHIEDDKLFLQKIFAMLEPGGQVIISVPARMKYWTVHDELVGHLRRYEKDRLKSLGTQSGFRTVVVTSYGYPWINWLSHLRVWLAKRTLDDRAEWSARQQTQKSNHQQIPSWLSDSLVPLLVNRFTVLPFALVSKLFNRLDLSDGYIVTMDKPSAANATQHSGSQS